MDSCTTVFSRSTAARPGRSTRSAQYHTRLKRMRRGAPMVFRQRNSQRFSNMDISPTEVRRAASAQPPSSNTSPSTEPNGSEILVKCLRAQNVKFLWGYPGGAVLYIYDALYQQDSIEQCLLRH